MPGVPEEDRFCFCITCSGYLLRFTENFLIMKVNMGSTDRLVRLIIAAVLVVLYFTGTVTGTLGTVLLVLAGVFVLTSIVRFCPLYAPFGLSTC
jgi:hypothetical protein